MSPLQLTTEAGCALAIGRYPRFRYDAGGGGGSGQLEAPDGEGWRPLAFAAEDLAIPALTWRTTRVLGMPLPPGLSITIAPQRLDGRWQEGSGAVELEFLARFVFGVAGIYQAPDLIVRTRLVTGETRGQRHCAVGAPLDRDGRGVLVGVAVVEPTGEAWLDSFLGLPDEALAVLRCRLLVG
jgi:hypothetical protein